MQPERETFDCLTRECVQSGNTYTQRASECLENEIQLAESRQQPSALHRKRHVFDNHNFCHAHPCCFAAVELLVDHVAILNSAENTVVNKKLIVNS